MKQSGFALVLAAALAGPAASGCVSGCERMDSGAISTGWNGDAKAPTRLILASPSHAYGGPVWMALEIDVAPGWYVYADDSTKSGPKLEWTGSANLAPPARSWPPPAWVDLNGRARPVYKRRVVLPISIAPLQAEQDIEVGLHVTYAVCAEICRQGFAVHHIRVQAAPAVAPPAAAAHADAIARAIEASRH